MAEVPLSEYIRRRRMSLAATDLQGSEEKIIDIALRYGYDSPTAFNRAFQSIHGIAPSQAKTEGINLKAYPPISFRITIKGEAEMNYRIEKKDAFKIIGISKPLCQDMEENFIIVPQMWQEAAANGTIPKLASLMNAQPMGILGVTAWSDLMHWKYYISVASTLPAPEGFEEYAVPSATWAIFNGEGPSSSIQELERRIATEWLPSSGYEYGNAPDIEVYLSPDPENTKYEIWIPVTKKENL